MLRLLAKVKKTEPNGRYRDPNGLEYGRYTVRVEVEGSAVQAISVPEGLKGRPATLKRDFLLPWGVKRGDLLVLDPRESARVVQRRGGPPADGPPPRGVPSLTSGDIDSDGYPEDVLSNAFVRGVVQPHRGARVVSLVGASGADRFAQPFCYVMGGKYLLLGGAEEAIAEAGEPGEVWKSPFERAEPQRGPDGGRVSYFRALKSPEGVSLRKAVTVGPDLPGLVLSYEVSYAGPAKAAGGNGERPADPQGQPAEGGEDSTSVTLLLRFTPAVVGTCGSQNVFDVPARDGARMIRYHRPGFGRRWRWRDWRDEHFGLGGGFVVSRHEELGNVLAILFHPRRASHASIRSDYTGPEVSVLHLPRKVMKGRRARFGAAFLVGEAADVKGDSMLLASVGARSGRGVPVALTLRSGARLDRVRARVETGRGRRTVLLKPCLIPEAGLVLTSVVEIAARDFPVAVSATVRGERLSLTLEG